MQKEECVMKKFLDLITEEVTKAFVECGYDAKYAKVTLSNRPDLCEYQCNGAMAASKEYKKAPFMIADDVVENSLPIQCSPWQSL